MSLNADFFARAGDFELEIALDAQDEIVVLFGPSGAGKSLTLAYIAGLRRPERGVIRIADRTVFDAAEGIELPPQQRRVGYVVQDLALFPHMTVRENVLVGLERDPDAVSRFEALRELLSIGPLDDRRPRELSGGQQQRVALARALVRESDVLLLDEPFSALDATLRADLRAELLRLRAEIRLPILFVTHDLREAHLLADRLAVIEDGRLLQFASRDAVFRRPASRRVAELTGVTNLFRATVERKGSTGTLRVAGATFQTSVPSTIDQAADVAIRAERCVLRRIDPDGALPGNCFVANITSELAFGNTHTLRFEPETIGPPVEVEVASRPYEVLGVASRRRWVIELPPADLHAMPPTAFAAGQCAIEGARASGIGDSASSRTVG